MSQNLENEIAAAKQECKARIARARAAQKRNDDRVRACIVKILEEKNPEVYSQLWAQAERMLSEQSRQRAQRARERKARVAEQGQGEQNG